MVVDKAGAPEALIVKNKRLDGRKFDQFRKMDAKAGNLPAPDGSGYFAFGNTRSLAGVFGPKVLHPRFKQKPTTAILRCKYAMAPFSTSDRIRPGHSRRGTEISKVIQEALDSVVYLENHPKTVVDIHMDVLQADASTRCAALNAASIALASAGIQMRNLICSLSVGSIDGKLVLDVGGIEDNYGEVDIAIATIGNEDKFVLLQVDGVIKKDDFFKALDIGLKGCNEVFEVQRNALKKRYSTGDANGKK